MTVADGHTGYLVPPRDPAALADRLAVLLSDRQLCSSMGLRGRQRAARWFTWDRVTRSIERLYVDVVQQAGAVAADRMPDETVSSL
jgi:glycosyltransferase involved in cell wall biosynthesis